MYALGVQGGGLPAGPLACSSRLYSSHRFDTFMIFFSDSSSTREATTANIWSSIFCASCYSYYLIISLQAGICLNSHCFGGLTLSLSLNNQNLVKHSCWLISFIYILSSKTIFKCFSPFLAGCFRIHLDFSLLKLIMPPSFLIQRIPSSRLS